MVDLIKRNLLKSIHNFILKAKQTISASKIYIGWNSYSNPFHCRFAFDTFDTNKDGSIDFDEFLLAISVTSSGDLDDRLSAAFDMYVLT